MLGRVSAGECGKKTTGRQAVLLSDTLWNTLCAEGRLFCVVITRASRTRKPAGSREPCFTACLQGRAGWWMPPSPEGRACALTYADYSSITAVKCGGRRSYSEEVSCF